MSAIYDELKLVKEELSKCMKCGNCMAVCPVYNTEKKESNVARGKIAMAEAVVSGELDLADGDVVHKFFDCLICKSCMTTCPTGVRFDRIALALRAAMARKNGLHPLKKVIFGTLKRQAIFDLGMRLGGTFQTVLFRRHPRLKAFYPRFPMGLDYKRILPQISTTPFRSQASTTPRIANPTIKVAFFTGCSINYMFPNIGHDIVEVLRENGVEVVIPKDQQCCGMAIFAHGDIEAARELARKNLDAFQKADAQYIITACGSCGGSWQHEFVELLEDDPMYAELAERWSQRTYDISTFLVNIIGYRRPQGSVEGTVTFHDSCHLKKSMKVFKEPREILQTVPGITLKEMSKPDACCGSGGSFSLTHYDTSMEINKRKLEDINQTGAQTIITGCPGCMIQLMDGANQFGEGQDVEHYISVLARAYRQEKAALREVL